MCSRAIALVLAVAGGCLGQAIDFERRIAPILQKNCVQCHGPSDAQGELRLHKKADALQVISGGKPDQSKLYLRIEMPSTEKGAMPPAGPQLPAADRDLIRRWIASGAPWPTAFVIGADDGKLKDNEALAARIHARIVAQPQETTAAQMKSYKSTIPNTVVSFEMVPIPAGDFVMGSPDSEKERSKDEGPQHKVHVETFWMGKYEVTWDEYRLFMFARQAGETPGSDPEVDAISRPTRPYVEMSFGMGINGFPAISMTQHAANKYAEWLSARTGQFYRLPTEAEWEYACRAGATTAFSYGDDPAKLGEYAVFAANSNGQYAKVGSKKPVAWGLYDMLGNVDEWTLDQYIPDWYAKAGADGRLAPSTTAYPQSVRGGSWNDPAGRVRCAARMGSEESWKMQDPQLPKSIWYFTDAQWLGFRLVRPLKIPSASMMYRYWNNGVERE
ncbi:MAG: SUMF1/EgtB/PvdO family nonheme iron enzyme [Bryobacteraceae bacterium]